MSPSALELRAALFLVAPEFRFALLCGASARWRDPIEFVDAKGDQSEQHSRDNESGLTNGSTDQVVLTEQLEGEN